tara:strand:+ start:3209 stop:3589 length:381 start_codon:yes stop_codon:yes gene_type:complete
MSTLNVSNVSDGTTTVATTYVTNGSAKAWCTLSMSGAEIKDSFNCGSATDIATGRFTVALTNDMSDVNYAVTSSAISHADANNGSNRTSGATSYQVGAVYINGMLTSTGVNNDVASCAFTANGDLA